MNHLSKYASTINQTEMLSLEEFFPNNDCFYKKIIVYRVLKQAKSN